MIPYLKCLFLGHKLDKQQSYKTKYHTFSAEDGSTCGFFTWYKVKFKCERCAKYIIDHKECETVWYTNGRYYNKETEIVDD